MTDSWARSDSRFASTLIIGFDKPSGTFTMFSKAVSRSSARGNSILDSAAFSEGVSGRASSVRKFLSRNSSSATASGWAGSMPEPDGSGAARRFSSTDSGSAGVLKPSMPSVGIAGLKRNAIELSGSSEIGPNAWPLDAIRLSTKRNPILFWFEERRANPIAAVSENVPVRKGNRWTADRAHGRSN